MSVALLAGKIALAFAGGGGVVCDVTRVYDGDTAFVECPGQPDELGLRFVAIDAAEMRPREEDAEQHREDLEMLLSGFTTGIVTGQSAGRWIVKLWVVPELGEEVSCAMGKLGVPIDPRFDRDRHYRDNCQPPRLERKP